MMPKDIAYYGKMFSMEDFGNWLQTHLDQRGINQSELSRLTGLNRGTISNIMNGTKGLGHESLTVIAHALRLPVDVVFRAAGLLPSEPTLDEQAAAIAHRASKMTQAEKRAVLAFMNSLEQGEIEPAPVPPIGGKLDPVSK